MSWLKRNSKNLMCIAFIILLALPIIYPLLRSGFFVTDDGEWMIIRLSAFYQALADGQFPVRFLARLNHEYGYPVSTFLYPGFLYIGSMIHLLKIGFVESVKVVLGLSIIGSAVFTFFWLRRFFEKIPSLVGALSLVYAPYFLFDIYKRGSVGEVVALSILPFILWQIQRHSLFWSSIGIGFLIISHNSLAAIFMIIITAYMLIDLYKSQERSRQVYWYICSIFLGLGLSAFFWLQILFELSLTKFSDTVISNPLEYFAGIWLIGYHAILVLLTSVLLFVLKKKSIKKHSLTVLMMGFGLVSVFLASTYSGFLWSILPVSFIQFPFRFLSVAIVSMAFLTAFAVSEFKGLSRNIFISILAIIFSISIFQQLSSIEYIDKTDGFYITNSATTTIHDEYMPVWVEKVPLSRFDEKVEIIEGGGEINNLIYNNKNIRFKVDLETDSVIQVNTIYWPGWKVYIDDKKEKISYNNPGGVMRVDAPEGKHNVQLIFGETSVRLVSDVVSILSLGMLVMLCRKKLWKK